MYADQEWKIKSDIGTYDVWWSENELGVGAITLVFESKFETFSNLQIQCGWLIPLWLNTLNISKLITNVSKIS